MAKSYTLTESSVRNINRTIRTVNHIRKNMPSGDLPFRQNQKRQPAGATLQIGKTSAEWTKGTDATLDAWKRNEAGGMEAVTKEDGTAVTFTAYNLFADVAADKFVGCIGKYLVSAECD
jgi:hypothetical protein